MDEEQPVIVAGPEAVDADAPWFGTGRAHDGTHGVEHPGLVPGGRMESDEHEERRVRCVGVHDESS